MSEQADEIERQVVAAVRRELARFGGEVGDRLDAVHLDATARNEAHDDLERRVSDLSAATERVSAETDARLGRAVVDANAGIAGVVSDLRRLDVAILASTEQAQRTADHVEQITAATDAGLNTLRRELSARIDERITAIEQRLVDEVAPLDERMTALEQRVADTARFDERMTAIEQRVADDVAERFGGLEATMQGLCEQVEQLDADRVDAEVIDDLRERVSSALGQAELVRIEMDRFQLKIDDTIDATAVRLTEIETTVQDQSMDVETAVQLERLEEVERAVLMLHPDAVARRQPCNGTTFAPPAPSSVVSGGPAPVMP